MNTKNWESSPACAKYLADNKMEWKDLPVHFFQKYMKIVTQHNFHIDGWEEVWEYEKTGSSLFVYSLYLIENLDSNGKGTGLYDIHSPEIWKDYINPDTELTAYHWNNMWQEYDTSSTGYMMANAGYKGPIKSLKMNLTGSEPEVCTTMGQV